MPYIIRNSSGGIARASVKIIPGAEMVAYDHPELQQFLRDNGQDPQDVEHSLTELRRTDADMTRAVEDVVVALLKKNILKMNDLPVPLQDRMASRVKLRVSIQEVYDRASGVKASSNPSTMIEMTLLNRP